MKSRDLHPLRDYDKVQDKAGNTFTIKEKIMARRFGKKERKIIRWASRQPRAKRAETEQVAERAAGIMGISLKEFAQEWVDGSRDARAAFQSAASESDGWKKHYTPKDPGARDWSSFFEGLASCFDKVAPIIISML